MEYESHGGGEWVDACPSSLMDIALYQVGMLIQTTGIAPNLPSPLPAEISNALIQCMHTKHLLNPRTIALLDDRFTITEADLSFCTITLDSLSVLIRHRLKRLSVFQVRLGDGFHLDVQKLVERLDCKSKKCLEYLNIGGVPLTNITSVTEFRNLTVIVVAESAWFGDVELAVICRLLRFLRVIDFSRTNVSSIGSLMQISNTLEVLVMHRVRLSYSLGIDPNSGIIPTLRSLRNLTYLDISDKKSYVTTFSSDVPSQIDLANLVITEVVTESNPWWPNLRFFDIAGNALHFDGIISMCSFLTNFIYLHPRLEYISILDTPLNRHPYHYPFEREVPIKISNGGTRAQCLLALQHYWRSDREAFTAHSLQAVYYLLQSSYDEFTVADIHLAVRGITLSMSNHLNNLSIQMAGSACLYHLCKLKRSQLLTPDETRKCVDRCLDAVERHQKTVQLQKNVWLTICNDHLLQTQNIDMYRTCAVALEAMVNTRDPSVSRMTIAIVSILAPKIPTTQSHALATNQRYVQYLIDVIKENIAASAAANENFSDFTIKFTLTALWNLTDESPETCQLFVYLGGLDAALAALNRFSDSANIQTKVLGLLNNVAEVKALQESMLHPFCIQSVLRLLDSDLANNRQPSEPASRIDVSYFAAGVIANLLLARPWSFEPTSAFCNAALIAAIKRWPNPILTMVAYRSFSPFFALLERDDLTGAQMWAAWAIQHVCSSDRQNVYVKMLISQGGHRIISRLANSKTASGDSVNLANAILDLIDNAKLYGQSLQDPSSTAVV
ncbi:hypothetical protein AB6A40_002948 [Gnathostoma spinigerum]|uniref:Protein zer-1 homolog-like C-terminal domain-containing protein n=1 Tax=Gnathostoma spinigerum TaxID=75299 RepID=A0ABD6EDK9_9BILA